MLKGSPIKLIPLYEQARREIESRIRSGSFPIGAYLPAEPLLGQELRVSPGTVRHALKLLEAKGIILRQQGKGTRVLGFCNERTINAFNNIRDHNGACVEGEFLRLSIETSHPNNLEQAKLELRREDRIIRERRLRRRRGENFLYEEIAVAITRLPGFPERPGVDYRITTLALDCGVLAARAVEHVTPVSLPENVAEPLGVDVDTPTLRLDRTIFTDDDWPIQWRLGYLLTARVEYACEAFSHGARQSSR